VTVAHAPTLLPLAPGEHLRFVFDMGACVGCHSCEVACAEQNALPVEVGWRRVGEVEGGEYPHTRRFHLSMACNHCLEPACMTGCPTEAYVKLSSGIVAHLADECIGCGYCSWNCPYSVPVMHPERKIATKCDMCSSRLDAGLTTACVAACPTGALAVETVDIDAWRADHAAADAPNLPPSDLTISTTRIVLPSSLPSETFAASDHALTLEHPHWPLVAVTLLTQAAMGMMVAAMVVSADRGDMIVASLLAALALPVSLTHLGHPLRAWKALRNVRRSWLSREVVAFSLFAAACLGTAMIGGGTLTAIAAVCGLAGVVASGRLYVVPGRPAWHSSLTIAAFVTSGVATGPLVLALLVDEHRVLTRLAAIAACAQLVVLGANLVRLQRRPQLEWRGTVVLTLGRARSWTLLRVSLAVVGAALAMGGVPGPALVTIVAGEIVGRWLFFVTVVPLNMPGSFFRDAR
jgi:formate dehydrogenase iron-sulfur subunit